jgi:hypothetical protein
MPLKKITQSDKSDNIIKNDPFLQYLLWIITLDSTHTNKQDVHNLIKELNLETFRAAIAPSSFRVEKFLYPYFEVANTIVVNMSFMDYLWEFLMKMFSIS